eukprot:1202839-Pyramimonas_sp.AAC.1
MGQTCLVGEACCYVYTVELACLNYCVRGVAERHMKSHLIHMGACGQMRIVLAETRRGEHTEALK